MLALQILIDGFAVSALYGLGAIGFTLIFGVSGVLNLAHGGIMLVAALFGWYVAADYGAGPYGGAAVGIVVGLLASYITYFVVIRPIQRSKAILKTARPASAVRDAAGSVTPRRRSASAIGMR